MAEKLFGVTTGDGDVWVIKAKDVAAAQEKVTKKRLELGAIEEDEITDDMYEHWTFDEIEGDCYCVYFND